MRSGYRHFIAGLTSQLRAGLPVREALALLASGGGRAAGSAWQERAGQLLAAVESGSTLGEAFDSLPSSIPPEHAALVAAGEESGTLVDILEQISADIERDTEYRRGLLRRLLYPVGAWCLLFLLPPVYLLITGRPGAYFGILLLGWSPLIIGFLAWKFRDRLFPPGSTAHDGLERVLFAIPLLGKSLREVATGRLLEVLGLLIRAGLGWHRSLGLVDRVAPWKLHRRAVRQVDRHVEGGATASRALAQLPVLDAEDLGRIAAGEHAGNIDAELLAVGGDLRQRVRTRLDALAVALPVVVLLLVAVVIVWLFYTVVSSYYGALDL